MINMDRMSPTELSLIHHKESSYVMYARWHFDKTISMKILLKAIFRMNRVTTILCCQLCNALYTDDQSLKLESQKDNQ